MQKDHVSRGFGIDVGSESVQTFAEAARYVGKLKGTKRIAFQTLFRWATKGCSGVVLETVCVGGSRCTSREALQRFFERVTRARSNAPAGEAVESGTVPAPLAEIGNVDDVLRGAGIAASEGGGE